MRWNFGLARECRMAWEQLGTGNAGTGANDGNVIPGNLKIGASASNRLGFYGTTPITKPSVTWPNTATATTTLNETKCQRLMVALVNLGLIVTT